MRDLPLRVHAVAREPAPDLVVDAPERHALQRIRGDPLGRAVARRGGAAQAEFEISGVREFGGPSESAVARVEAGLQAAQGRGYRLPPPLRLTPRHPPSHPFVDAPHLLALP